MSENVNAKTNHKLNTETLFKETKSPTLLENQCSSHFQDYILFCLKCQEKICTKCLDTNHLLHPVVPLNSLNKLDFKISL
ncbi:MAG: B-box zinc finger protein [bacterium]